MESWDGWDDFLKIIASDYDLTVDQEAVFLVRLSRQSIDRKRTNQDIANEVIGGESDKALYAYNKRMKEVFDKLSQNFSEINSDSRGKVERTQTCLEKTYLEQQNKENSKVLFNAIAPPDWHKICHERLESQKQNIRRQATEIVSELFYVQLGLVERRHQPRRSNDVSISPEQGSGFFQLDKEEIIETYEHDEFLQQVIKHKQSKKSQGKRIAIIGEPGAGKTTLLEAIAFSPKTPDFPIWISLGSLGDKSLEEYLCQKWLKDALKTSDVTQQQKQLEELFKSGEVLLLLDGVDEMPAPSPVEALAKIREELTGWVADARVVLTCRVNVWDASVNALQGFDTYRTLEFSYGDGHKPDQVTEFICQWFSNTDKPELGEPLRKKLDEESRPCTSHTREDAKLLSLIPQFLVFSPYFEDRYQRIRDLVKSPLRLSLLCQSWYFRQGDLPKTKAALYEQFTRAFYDWKEDAFPTTLTERKKLNEKLGLLAREAIDKENSRFGIRESFALNIMGEDLFNLACKLHWLNFVYKDAYTEEKVYAFFHPTFQEYFAACAIDDWHYFLNHNNENPNPFQPYKGKDCVYRVFDKQWKEVILLWLGCEEVVKEQKDELMWALVKFEDGCSHFFNKKYLFYLSLEGIREFYDCILTETYYDEGELDFRFNDEWQHYWLYIAPFIYCGNSIDIMRDTIQDKLDNWLGTWMHSQVIFKTSTFEPRKYREHKDLIQQLNIDFKAEIEIINESKSIKILIDFLNDDYIPFVRGAAIKKLVEINYKNPDITNDLIAILSSSTDKAIHRSLSWILEKVKASRGRLDAIKVMNNLLSKSKDELTILAALEYFFDPVSWLKTLPEKIVKEIIANLKKIWDTQTQEKENNYYWYYFIIIWIYAEKINYFDFYQAWHGQRSTLQILENKVTNTPSQIQPTDKTYPIALDTQTLKLETQTSAIAQKLCTKIYRKAGYSEIPTVSDAAQLQQYIPRIQAQLQKPNLALILHACEPNEHLINFCYSLGDRDLGIYISLITSQPVEQPLKGFLPNQENLLSAIQSWINEIG